MANRYPLIVDSSSQQIKEFPSGDTLVIDNLQVTGTTTTLETATLNVEDKNITINYSSGDSSSTADGSGLTFQDAVDASTDATILWVSASDVFQFSHPVEVNDATLNVYSSSATAVIGKIGNTANDINIYSTGTGHNGLRFHVNGILPTDNTGTIIDNDADLGDPSYRFKDMYLSGVAKVDSSAYISQQAITSSSNSIAWNAETQANAYHLLTENTTFAAPSNAVEGAIISVEIAQGGTPYTVAWNTVFEFAASTAPTMTATANKTDILSFRYNGSIWQEIGRVQNLAQT